MRKGFVLLCFFMLLLVGACGNMENDAIAHGKELIEKLYTVDDPGDYEQMSAEQLMAVQHEFSGYFTEKEFEDLRINRFFLMPLEAASKQNSTITVENIELERYDKEESDALDFNHTFTLVFENQEVKIEGQMTMIETEDGWKIDRYYDSKIPANLLQP